MVLLRYRRGKLLFHAFVALTFLLFYLGFYLHPETIDASHGRFARLLSSDFGRMVLTPGAIGFSGLMVLGSVTTALGRGVAIEAAADALVVTGIWRTRRFAWGQLGRLEIERWRTLSTTH
jgi:hypothetical protein